MNITKINLLSLGEMKNSVGSFNSLFFMRIDVAPVSFQFENGAFKEVKYFRDISREEEESPEFNPHHYLTLTRSIVFGFNERHKSGSHGRFSEKTLKSKEILFGLNRHIIDCNGDLILDILAGSSFEKPLTEKEYDILNDTLDLAKKREEECLIETRLKEFPRNNKLLDCELYLDKEKKIYFKATIEKKSKKLIIEISSPEKNRKIILEKKLTSKEIKDIEIVTNDTLTEEVIKKATKRAVDDGRN